MKEYKEYKNEDIEILEKRIEQIEHDIKMMQTQLVWECYDENDEDKIVNK